MEKKFYRIWLRGGLANALKGYLTARGIYREVSECDYDTSARGYHFEILATKDEANEINEFLHTVDYLAICSD